MSTFRTIPALIKACGGARCISRASLSGQWPLKVDAIYKWPHTGIPDRHWVMLMTLVDTSAEELYAANCAARGVDVPADEVAA